MLNKCVQRELIPLSLEPCFNKSSSKFYLSDGLANQRSTEYTSDRVHYSTDVAPIIKWINICTTIIGSLGLIANITAIVILLLIKSGRLFNRDRSGQNPTECVLPTPSNFLEDMSQPAVFFF